MIDIDIWIRWCNLWIKVDISNGNVRRSCQISCGISHSYSFLDVNIFTQYLLFIVILLFNIILSLLYFLPWNGYLHVYVDLRVHIFCQEWISSQHWIPQNSVACLETIIFLLLWKNCDCGYATKTRFDLRCGYFIQLNKEVNPETTFCTVLHCTFWPLMFGHRSHIHWHRHFERPNVMCCISFKVM